FIFFFFFSSRRRHTRLQGDWSSDVCSSDLTRWKDEPLVVDKWLAVQAGSRLTDTLPRVRRLLSHPAFDIKVPNKVYALVRTFSEIGRASCRERGEISEVAEALKKNEKERVS